MSHHHRHRGKLQDDPAYTGTLEITSTGPVVLLGLRETLINEPGLLPNATFATMPAINKLEDVVTLTLHAMRVADLDTATGSTTFYATDPSTGNTTSATTTDGTAVIQLPRGQPVILDYTNSTVYNEWTLTRNYLKGENLAVRDWDGPKPFTPSGSGDLYLIKINSIDGEPIVINGAGQYLPYYTLTEREFRIIMESFNGSNTRKFADPLNISLADTPLVASPIGYARVHDAADYLMEHSRGTLHGTLQPSATLPASKYITFTADPSETLGYTQGDFTNSPDIQWSKVFFAPDYNGRGPYYATVCEEAIHGFTRLGDYNIP